MRRTPGYPCRLCGAQYCGAIVRLWLRAMREGKVAYLGQSYRDFLDEYEDWQVGDAP